MQLDIQQIFSTRHQAPGNAVLSFLAHAGKTLFQTRHGDVQFPVVQSEQFQHCRMQIVDMDFVFNSPESDVIGSTDDFSALDASAGQEH